MSATIREMPIGGGSRGALLAAVVLLPALLFGVVYDPLYGGAILAVTVVTTLLCLAPNVAFGGTMLMLTGWPYYAGIPIGRDLPIPFVLPLIAAVFLSVMVRMLLGIDRPAPADRQMHWVDAGVAALALALILSIVLGGFPSGGWQSYFRVAFAPGLLYVCCRWHMRSTQTTLLAFNLLLIGSCIGGVYASAEWFMGKNPLLETFAPPVGDLANHGYWTATQGNYSGLYRSHGFGMNPIFFGATAAMLLIHAAARFATSERLSGRAWAVGLGTLAGAGLLSTFSRGPIMACGMGIVLMAVSYRRLRPYLLAVAVAAGVFLAYDLTLSSNSFLSERINDSDNVTLRFKLWHTALAMFLDHPLAGVGLSAFPDHQIETIRAHGIGPFFELGDGRLETVKTAEQGFLQFGAECGLLGFAAAGLMFGAAARIIWPALWGGREPTRSILVTCGGAIVVYLGTGLTVTVFNSWEAGSLLPVFLAALANGRELRATPPPASAAPH